MTSNMTLPTPSSNAIERIVVTEATTFEDILQAAYHSLHCANIEPKPRLTWTVSSNWRKGPAACLDNATDWVCALRCARKKISHQQKVSGVEIIVCAAKS